MADLDQSDVDADGERARWDAEAREELKLRAESVLKFLDDEVEFAWSNYHDWPQDDHPMNAMNVIISFLDQAGYREIAQRFAVTMGHFETSWEDDEYWDKIQARHDFVSEYSGVSDVTPPA